MLQAATTTSDGTRLRTALATMVCGALLALSGCDVDEDGPHGGPEPEPTETPVAVPHIAGVWSGTWVTTSTGEQLAGTWIADISQNASGVRGAVTLNGDVDCTDGVMRAAIQGEIPFVLAGSIRDDGPLPEVIADAYQAQDRMRDVTRGATTVIGLATQLHSIATGNMVPSYKVLGEHQVRPVYFYNVDMSEFAVNKLADRGSLAARSILTNVQDFVVNVERGIRKRGKG